MDSFSHHRSTQDVWSSSLLLWTHFERLGNSENVNSQQSRNMVCESFCTIFVFPAIHKYKIFTTWNSAFFLCSKVLSQSVSVFEVDLCIFADPLKKGLLQSCILLNQTDILSSLGDKRLGWFTQKRNSPLWLSYFRERSEAKYFTICWSLSNWSQWPGSWDTHKK